MTQVLPGLTLLPRVKSTVHSLVWLTLLSFALACPTQGESMSHDAIPIDSAAAQALMQKLTSERPAEADAAVANILHRGAEMVPWLLRLRGHREPFAGDSLLNPRSSILLPKSIPGFSIPESEKYRMVSVEVAAIYLVSALQRGDIHFAQAPLLVDTAEAPPKRLVANTPERVARAFDAAQQWYQTRITLGRDPLSSRDTDPLAASGLRWY